LPRDAGGGAEGAPLTLLDVAGAFADVAAATGAGVRRTRDERLARLAARASADERDFLNRIIGGEMRTGVSEGLLLEAIALAWGVELSAARRAALFLGDLGAVATLAAAGGAAAVAGATPRPFVQLLPMLAELADDFAARLTAAAVPGIDAALPARARRGGARARDAAGAALLRLPHGRRALAHRRAVRAALAGADRGDGRALSRRTVHRGLRGGGHELSRPR